MTPMLKQYQSIKERYTDSLLFFRLGDFYELFFEDAEKAAPILGVALTRRGKVRGGDIPMCGVPYHAAETYIAKVLKAGLSIAVCDQVESVEDARKRGANAVVMRDVVRVMTPGTVVEDAFLTSQQHNYLLALHQEKNTWFISYVDISTSSFFVEACEECDLENILGRVRPKEVILSVSQARKDWLIKLIKAFQGAVSIQPDVHFSYTKAHKDLLRFLGVEALDGFGNFESGHISAAGAIAHYIFLTHKSSCPEKIKLYKSNSKASMLDYATIASLEIFETTRGVKNGSFFHHINGTKTAGGQRLLAKDILTPLHDKTLIEKRLLCVEFCLENKDFHERMHACIGSVSDIERVLARVNIGRFSPHDIAKVRCFLCSVERLQAIVNASNVSHSALAEWTTPLYDFPKTLHDLLTHALEEETPHTLGAVPVISEGFDVTLDALRGRQSTVHARMKALEKEYSVHTGINLKIRTNNVSGYYIEATKKQAEKMPDSFTRVHTLVNTVRFSTAELKALEQEVVQASEAYWAYEADVFSAVVAAVKRETELLLFLVQVWSRLDVVCSHAHLARTHLYVQPKMMDTPTLHISGGWHPVLKSLTAHSFVPNDCVLEEGHTALITGPNMGGKSTFVRQNALAVLMAHIGAFVPAKEASMGLVDRIFSRVGSSDDLTKGRSTFMVEMLETAAILNQASDRSFMILDEVGRGTSTHDGVALAWAIMEYIHNVVRARCLFATHYHELANLEKSLDSVKNYRVSVREWDGGISFDYRIVPGFTNRSYGVHVAQQAGMPKGVLRRAKELLPQFENVKSHTPIEKTPPQKSDQDVVRAWCKGLDVDNLTPKQALDVLYSLIKEKNTDSE